MAQLPEQAVKEFTELYKQEYGVDLEPDEASVRAFNFLNLYRTVLDDFGTSETKLPP